MNDLESLQKYFSLAELVNPDLIRRYGSQCWTFIPKEAITMLLKVRRRWNSYLLVNYQDLKNCGLRKPNSPHSYMSAHKQGMAFDLHSNDNPRLYSMIKEHHKELGVFQLENREATNINDNDKKSGWVHCSCRGFEFRVINP